MQRVIALDIGSYSIKAVEIVNTFKSYEIVNFYENPVPHLNEVPVDVVVPICMEQLFRENKLEADRIVTAMPGQFIASRVVGLGFSDPRKVAAAVLSEIEDAVPFNLDDMIIDHQILGTHDDKTVALAVMTRKEFLKNFLGLLQRIHIDPKLVDIDSLAFYNLSSYLKVDPDECFAMVDMGHEKTSVCIVRGGVLRMFRTINLGGRYITEFLARDLETTYHEAQRIKHRVSRVLCEDDQGENLSKEEHLIVERTTVASNAIVKELGRTLYSFKSWDKRPVSRMFLSGGTSQIKNLTELISAQLELKAVHCRLEDTDLKIKDGLFPYMSILPQGVAIGMRTVGSVKKQSTINLRTGEFSYVQNYENILRASARGLKICAAVLGLLLFSYGVKYFFYAGHINNLQAQYKKEFLEVFPDQKTRYAKPVEFARLKKEAEAKLRTQIDMMKKGVSAFKAENSGSPSLLLLRDLSAAIPKELVVDVTTFDFKSTENGEGKLTLRAETDGYKSQGDIVDAIKKVKSLSEVKEKQSGVKPGTNGKIIEFVVEARYQKG